MTTEDVTPEALLKRAVEALDRAQADSDDNSGTSWDWVGVSQAAVGAGQLALDIQNSEPRTVVVDDLSKAWRDGIESITTDPALNIEIEEPGQLVKEGRQAWLNPDEWEDLLAVRAGAAAVLYRKPSVEAAEMPVDDLADVAGTHDHPRPLGMPDGDVQDLSWAEEMNANLNDQERRYRTIIVGLLLARSTVSEYVPGPLIRQTPPWRLEIGENPADGAVTLRIDRS